MAGDTKQTITKASELQARFDCVDSWDIGEEMGFRAMPISGQFLRHYDLDAFVFILKATLPADVKLTLYDGLSIRPSFAIVDEYFMVFASEKWPVLQEGAEIPRLRPLVLREATGDPLWETQIVTVPKAVECRLVIDKQTHALLIPKEEETDEQCVVIVRPKG